MPYGTVIGAVHLSNRKIATSESRGAHRKGGCLEGWFSLEIRVFPCQARSGKPDPISEEVTNVILNLDRLFSIMMVGSAPNIIPEFKIYFLKKLLVVI